MATFELAAALASGYGLARAGRRGGTAHELIIDNGVAGSHHRGIHLARVDGDFSMPTDIPMVRSAHPRTLCAAVAAVAMGVSCAPEPAPRAAGGPSLPPAATATSVVATTSGAASAGAASAAPATKVAELPAPPAVARFAAAHGGLHAGPYFIPRRRFDNAEMPCWLFFVGGDAAHAAWVATNITWSLKRVFGPGLAMPPGVSAFAVVAAEDGVFFERVEGLPKAIRVLDASLTSDPTERAVLVESLPAREQPAAARALVTIGEHVGAGSPMSADRDYEAPWRWFAASDALAAARNEPRARGGGDTKSLRAFLAAAAASDGALAARLGSTSAPIVEVWQRRLGVLVERVDAATLARSARKAELEALTADASQATYCWSGVCPARGEDRGVVVDLADGAAPRIAAFVVPGSGTAQAESPPAPAPAWDALATVAMYEPSTAGARVLAASDVGGGRFVAAVLLEGQVLIVEREGAYSSVDTVAAAVDGAHPPDARIADLDGDGVADVALFVPKPPQITPWGAPPGLVPVPGTTAGARPDPFEVRGQAMALLRKARLGGPAEDVEASGLAMLGARDVDDAVSRAVHRKTLAAPTEAEACTVLRASATPAALRAHAAPGASVVYFVEPGKPSSAVRHLPARAASAAEAQRIAQACDGSGDWTFRCEGTRCGHLYYALGDRFAFTRVDGKLVLALALLYAGV